MQRVKLYIYCRFLNQNVYFQTLPEEITENNHKVTGISNLRDFVMVITPKLKFEFHRDYKKALKELKDLQQSYKLLNEEEKREKRRLLE